jgi:hypothetical protein
MVNKGGADGLAGKRLPRESKGVFGGYSKTLQRFFFFFEDGLGRRRHNNEPGLFTSFVARRLTEAL